MPGWVGGVATVPVQGGLLTYEVLAGTTEPVLAFTVSAVSAGCGIGCMPRRRS